MVRLLRRPVVLVVLAALILTAGLVAWWQWPAQFLRQGEVALRDHNYQEARTHLARYLSYRPDDCHARLLAARAARNLGEYYESLEHLRHCESSADDHEALTLEAALVAVARGQEPDASLRQRAEVEDELALEILEVLIQYDIDNYRLREALHELTRYLKIRPNDLQARLARGFVWERFLFFADALEDYHLAVQSHPESEEARLKLAQTMLIAATPGEALTQYQWLADRHPDEPRAMLGLARCRRLLGDTEEAKRLLTSLQSRSPESGEVLWEMGQLHLDGGQAAEAEPLLRKAMEITPHDRRIAFSLSRCLLVQGKVDEAAKIEARVAEIDADLRRLDELRQAVMEDPRNAGLRIEGGMIFVRNGERQEGLRWLRLAVRLAPHSEEASRALASAESKER